MGRDHWLGIALGPIAGGLLLSRFWWGSIFLVNVPIVCIGLIGAVIFSPESKNPHVQRPDPVGAAFSIVGLGLLLWSIIKGPTQGWSSVTVWAHWPAWWCSLPSSSG